MDPVCKNREHGEGGCRLKTNAQFVSFPLDGQPIRKVAGGGTYLTEERIRTGDPIGPQPFPKGEWDISVVV